MIRPPLVIAAAALVAACGNSNADQLGEAARQSDPAAANVLMNAAENGTEPRQALQEAGNAQVAAENVMGPETSNGMVPPEPMPRPGEKAEAPPPNAPS